MSINNSVILPFVVVSFFTLSLYLLVGGESKLTQTQVGGQKSVVPVTSFSNEIAKPLFEGDILTTYDYATGNSGTTHIVEASTHGDIANSFQSGFVIEANSVYLGADASLNNLSRVKGIRVSGHDASGVVFSISNNDMNPSNVSVEYLNDGITRVE